MLIPFSHKSLKLKNKRGLIPNGGLLGSGCFAEWVPQKEDLIDIIRALSYASSDHRDDLVSILES